MFFSPNMWGLWYIAPLLIDVFAAAPTSHAEGHEPDTSSLTMATGKGSSFNPTVISVAAPVSSRTCHRLFIVVVLVYYCIVTGSAVRHTAV